MLYILPNQPLQSWLRRFCAKVVVALVAFVSVLSVNPPAEAASVPRLIPSRIPTGYVIEEVVDNQEPSSNPSFVTYFRSDSNDAALAVFGEPFTSSDWKELAKQFKADKYTKTTIKGKLAFISPSGPNRAIFWFSGKQLYTSYSFNVDLKTDKVVNASVKETRGASGSFRAKGPAGFSQVYSGPVAALRGSYSRLMFVIDASGAHNHLIVEVTSIDRRYIDMYLLSPLVSPTTQATVNGKPAYKTVTESYSTYWWEQEPGLLVEVTGSAMADAALLDVANSVAPAPEAAFESFKVEAESATSQPEAVSPDLVGAGMVGVDPWTAQLATQPNCLVFTMGGVQTSACLKGTNSLGWSKATVAPDKLFVVGVAAANVATIVVRSNGAEVGRAQVNPVVGQPTLRSFVASIPAGAGDVTVSGLDVAGNEVQPAIGART